MRNVTAAVTQMSCSRDREENLQKAERLVRQAAEQGAQIILLQELFETQYFCQTQNFEYMALARPLSESPAVKRLSALAKETETVIPVSFLSGMEIRRSTVWLSWTRMEAFWVSTARRIFRTACPMRKSFILRRGHGLSRVEYQIRKDRCGNLLGPVVPGSGQKHGSSGSGTDLLSYGHWFRARIGN